MVVLQPQRQQLWKMTAKIDKRFNIVSIEVVFEDVINDLSLAFPKPIPKLLHYNIESLRRYLAQLQIVARVLQQFQPILHVQLKHPLPTQSVPVTQLHKLDTLQHLPLLLQLAQNVLLVVLYSQVKNYRIDFPQLAHRIENQLRAVE